MRILLVSCEKIGTRRKLQLLSVMIFPISLNYQAQLIRMLYNIFKKSLEADPHLQGSFLFHVNLSRGLKNTRSFEQSRNPADISYGPI